MGGFEFEIEVDEDVDVPDAQDSPPLHDQPDPSKFDVDPKDLEKEIEDAINQGVPIDPVALQKTAVGAKIARLWFVKRKRARINIKLARLRRMAANEKGTDTRGRYSRAGTWSPQNPMRELDVARTFSTHGAFIPGVTTQRQRYRPDPTGRPAKSSFSHMNFLLDLSSSMTTGVSPAHPLDVRTKASADEPWTQTEATYAHKGNMGPWDRDTPLVPDPAGPKGGYPKWEIRVPVGLGLPDEGRVMDPIEIRRICEVMVEVVFAMLQEAQKRRNTVSVISFDSAGRLELSRTRDYAEVERVLVTLEPEGATEYKEALALAVKETKLAGGKAMTVIVTDAHSSDLLALTPGGEKAAVSALDAQASAARRAGEPQLAAIYRSMADKRRGQVALLRELISAGPVFLVCLGQDPEKDDALKTLLSTMRNEYGANFEVAAFPDVSTEDAVFQAARWSVRL